MKNSNTMVIVEKPLRIDLAGGWSDTPPICNALGGCVLNAAVVLEDIRPVCVKVKRIENNEVFVESIDLRRKGVLRTEEELHDHHDPHDWLALVKSALAVCGYEYREGGLSIQISAAVPKGSGMGTSSILGAALVEALCKIREKSHDFQRISQLVLQLEHEMCTGGGWEDQAGALVPGVKLIESEPGDSQILQVIRASKEAEIALSKFFDDRALLYFTGRKRMARNVLRGVVNFFKQDPDGLATEIIQTIKSDAQVGFQAINQQNWHAFCTVINSYWLNKKALDPGSTNASVESIIARISPWTSAVTLCGAGGGGFMLIIARSPEAKRKIQNSLERHPPIAGGRFYRFSIFHEA